MTVVQPSQRALANRMSEISKAPYCAGSMQDLEHSLWRAVLDWQRRYGRVDLSEQDVDELAPPVAGVRQVDHLG